VETFNIIKNFSAYNQGRSCGGEWCSNPGRPSPRGGEMDRKL